MMALLRYLLAFVSVGIGGLVRAQAEGSTYDVLDYVDAEEELDEEARDTREQLGQKLNEIRTMVIRLIDRVRVLEINFIEHCYCQCSNWCIRGC